MNPYKAAIKLVRKVLADEFDTLSKGRDKLINQLVDDELSELYAWISTEDNGLTPEQIIYAHECAFEGGASGLPECDACKRPFDVHMLVTRRDTGETKEVRACKAHMLDPGPLLDW
jgi:hypothetical protein